MINLQTDTVIGFDDAAAKLGVTARTIRRWARVGHRGVKRSQVQILSPRIP